MAYRALTKPAEKEAAEGLGAVGEEGGFEVVAGGAFVGFGQGGIGVDDAGKLAQ